MVRELFELHRCAEHFFEEKRKEAGLNRSIFLLLFFFLVCGGLALFQFHNFNVVNVSPSRLFVEFVLLSAVAGFLFFLDVLFNLFFGRLLGGKGKFIELFYLSILALFLIFLLSVLSSLFGSILLLLGTGFSVVCILILWRFFVLLAMIYVKAAMLKIALKLDYWRALVLVVCSAIISFVFLIFFLLVVMTLDPNALAA